MHYHSVPLQCLNIMNKRRPSLVARLHLDELIERHRADGLGKKR
jgi:hypothetical protein